MFYTYGSDKNDRGLSTSISALFSYKDLAISKCPSLHARKNGEQPFFVRQSTFPPLKIEIEAFN